jgi:GGDEF domain-containing protein
MNKIRKEVMDRKFSRSKLSVFFIDLDNFKSIDDKWDMMQKTIKLIWNIRSE